jgi:hypothetical protein
MAAELTLRQPAWGRSHPGTRSLAPPDAEVSSWHLDASHPSLCSAIGGHTGLRPGRADAMSQQPPQRFVLAGYAFSLPGRLAQ